MRFLISNDDGYFSPGIEALYQTLSYFGQVVVVAPERDKSGASNSLTLDRPLTLRKAPNDFFFVNGTPTDCVHLAVTGMLDFEPDMIFSGINLGANLGDDTLYSGTVAAATEGFLLGIPSIAVSLASRSAYNFPTAQKVVHQLVERFIEQPLTEPTLLNVNIPDTPSDQLKHIIVTRLGRRHHTEPVIKTHSPRGETIYWVGPAGEASDAAVGTDFWAIKNQHVSITPLMVDLTAYSQREEINSWLAL